MLHELCTALNKLGYQAGVAIITEGSMAHQNFKFGFTASPEFLDPSGIYFDYFSNKSISEIIDFINNSCVIYPEIIKGNPLNGCIYANYVLAKTSFEVKADYIIGFSKLYIDQPNLYLHKQFISEFMHDRDTVHWTQRNLSLTYFGKGPLHTDCFLVDGTVLIERDWPRDKSQLAALLRNCKYFYSWDTMTATVGDAILCGAVPVFMQEKPLSLSELNNGELGPYPKTWFNFSTNQAETDSVQAIDEALKELKINMHQFEIPWVNGVKILAEDLQRLKLSRFGT